MYNINVHCLENAALGRGSQNLQVLTAVTRSNKGNEWFSLMFCLRFDSRMYMVWLTKGL